MSGVAGDPRNPGTEVRGNGRRCRLEALVVLEGLTFSACSRERGREGGRGGIYVIRHALAVRLLFNALHKTGLSHGNGTGKSRPAS